MAWKRMEIRPVRCHRTYESIRGERPFHRSRRHCAKNTGLKYLFYRLDRRCRAEYIFGISLEGCLSPRLARNTRATPPLSPLPPRNANSAIEFSGILPDAVELNFAATLCRYTRALPSPPIPFYSDCRASLIPLSTSLDIFHGIGKGGQEKRRATSLLLIRRRFPRSGFKGGEFESWERETLWLKEKGNEGVTRPRVGALRKSSAFKRGCFLPAGNFSKRKMCLTSRHRPNEQMIEDDFCLDRYRYLDKMMWKKIEKMWMRWNGIYIYIYETRIW